MADDPVESLHQPTVDDLWLDLLYGRVHTLEEERTILVDLLFDEALRAVTFERVAKRFLWEWIRERNRFNRSQDLVRQMERQVAQLMGGGEDWDARETEDRS